MLHGVLAPTAVKTMQSKQQDTSLCAKLKSISRPVGALIRAACHPKGSTPQASAVGTEGTRCTSLGTSHQTGTSRTDHLSRDPFCDAHRRRCDGLGRRLD